jgi:glycosyltransferase involved in cell wall biosynthesis
LALVKTRKGEGMKTLKILIFNWRDITHPCAGGAELHIHELAKRWVQRGHCVTLFCGSYSGAKSRDEIDGIKIVRKGGRFSIYLFAVFEYVTKLRTRDYDLIVDDVNGIPWFTPLFTRKPKIAILHHLVKGIFFKELPLVLAGIGYSIESVLPVIYRTTPIVTGSESSKRELIEAGIPEPHVTVVPNGVDHRVYKPRAHSKSPHPQILYLGRLRTYKNLDCLIRAMESVLKAVPDVKLSLVGTGGAETELKELTRALGLDAAVTFHGYATEEEKVTFYQSAWLYVTPSEKEGWGLTVIEANACGTPAVAFDVPGLRDSIRDGQTGLLVKKGDITALAATIVNILKDEKLREALSKAALDHAQHFSWDNTAEEFSNVMERVINDR